jgi:glycosyltransferase involved in cell wall biosynthesis
MVAGSIKVVQMLPDLESGGVERGTLELGKYLSAHGHESIVISAGGRMVSRLGREGSRHIFWAVGRKGPTVLQYIWSLRRLLVQEKVDILHLRSRLPAWIGYLAWKSLPKRRRPRLVTTFHGFYSVNAYSAIMTKGERVIAISNTIAAHIKERYGVADDRVTVIYRGFDETAFNPEKVSQQRIEKLKAAWQIKELKAPLLMLPGRVTRWKGHDVFLTSLYRIRHLQWSAVCVGDKNENKSYTERLARMLSELRLGNRVKFVGHCDDMPAAYMLADVVVSASSTEPEAFGRIAVEAQAMGKPVIASAHGGSLETVQHQRTGWLVEPRNEVSLAKALGEAISNLELRNIFGSDGLKWVRKNFTVSKMCQSTLEVYYHLLY